jgi:hypothetical protein
VAGVAGDATAPEVGLNTLVIVVYPGPLVASAIRAHKNHIGPGRARGTHVANGADAARITVTDTPPRVGKRRPQPSGRVVAGRACGCGIDDSRHGRVGGHVIRYRPTQGCGALPLSGVATVTIGRRPGRTGVAKVASQRWRHMRAGQRETGGVVVKRRTQPGGRRVARRAGGWIAGSNMVRYQPAQRSCALPLNGVARIAIGWRRSGADVAKIASYGHVRPSQRERRVVVIEIRCCPIERGVTDGAIRREA